MRKSIGFTLVELLVVVIIIAVLAAVAVPMMRTTKARAICSEAVGMLGSLRQGAKVYYMERKAWPVFPPGPMTGNPTALDAMGFKPDDLQGRYWNKDCYFFGPGYIAAEVTSFGEPNSPEVRNLVPDGDRSAAEICIDLNTGRIYQNDFDVSGLPPA